MEKLVLRGPVALVASWESLATGGNVDTQGEQEKEDRWVLQDSLALGELLVQEGMDTQEREDLLEQRVIRELQVHLANREQQERMVSLVLGDLQARKTARLV